MNIISTFLTSTPWYVYLIFAYLVFVGIKALKGGILPLGKLFILPIIFVWMSVDTINQHLGFTSIHLGYWALGIVIGSVIGWWQFNRLNIVVDQQHKLLQVPGSVIALTLIVLTFAVKYYIGYTLVAHPHFSIAFAQKLLVISVVFNGFFIGRLINGLQRLKRGPSVNLKKTT